MNAHVARRDYVQARVYFVIYSWSRGSEEVGSCNPSHIKHMTTSATTLILYSDSCGGQNSNINLSCLWLLIVANPNYSFTTIEQKFMVVGHSYLPNDQDFGVIETARRSLCSCRMAGTCLNSLFKLSILCDRNDDSRFRFTGRAETCYCQLEEKQRQR